MACLSPIPDMEIYVSVEQIGETFNMSPAKATLIFEGLPGVLDWGSPDEKMHKRPRRMLRVPISLVRQEMAKREVKRKK
jgi:hypothetical protein